MNTRTAAEQLHISNLVNVKNVVLEMEAAIQCNFTIFTMAVYRGPGVKLGSFNMEINQPFFCCHSGFN